MAGVDTAANAALTAPRQPGTMKWQAPWYGAEYGEGRPPSEGGSVWTIKTLGEACTSLLLAASLGPAVLDTDFEADIIDPIPGAVGRLL